MSSTITELKTTVFLTPIRSTFFRYVSLLLLKLSTWKVAGDKPSCPKYILVAAPHTSNWDFVLLLLAFFALRMDARWMGKDTLFPFPIKRFMVWLGGIPIDRGRANNLVGQMVGYYQSVDSLVVLIPPEGTRSKVERWKTGFYHIAHQAGVPIVLGYVDASTKTVGMGPAFIPSANVDQDMLEIQSFYKSKIGVNPENQ